MPYKIPSKWYDKLPNENKPGKPLIREIAEEEQEQGLADQVQRLLLENARLQEQLAKTRPVEDSFAVALRLEQQGEWDQAITAYERIAVRLAGQQDGQYARNCAERLRERQSKR